MHLEFHSSIYQICHQTHLSLSIPASSSVSCSVSSQSQQYLAAKNYHELLSPPLLTILETILQDAAAAAINSMHQHRVSGRDRDNGQKLHYRPSVPFRDPTIREKTTYLPEKRGKRLKDDNGKAGATRRPMKMGGGSWYHAFATQESDKGKV
jgi:hypothetical protein